MAYLTEYFGRAEPIRAPDRVKKSGYARILIYLVYKFRFLKESAKERWNVPPKQTKLNNLKYTKP